MDNQGNSDDAIRSTTPPSALTEATMDKMTLEQVEHIRQYGYLNQKQLYALCDLAKLALSLPPDVAGLVSELRVLAEKATPGPWVVYDGSSWRRIGTLPDKGNYDGAVLAPCIARDGHPDLTSYAQNRENNLAYIAAANPANMTKLLDCVTSQAARIRGLEGKDALRDRTSLEYKTTLKTYAKRIAELEAETHMLYEKLAGGFS